MPSQLMEMVYRDLTWDIPVSGQPQVGDTASTIKSHVFMAPRGGGSLSLPFTGTTNGAIEIRGGNFHNPKDLSDRWNGSDFQSVNSLFATFPANPAGSADSNLYLMSDGDIQVMWLYLLFTRASGSGQMRGRIAYGR